LECTQEEIDLNNHLSKLATRTKIIGQALTNFMIVPVILTKLVNGMVNTTGAEKVRQEGIVIVTADELQHLARMAMERAGPSEVGAYLQQLKGSLFGLRPK
jgi:hypothetical protein